MQEVLPGVHHWSVEHPDTGGQAHGHFHEPSGTVFDPLIPEEGLEWFDGRGVSRVVLSCRHHTREADEIARHFDCPILAHEAGVDDLGDLDSEVKTFATGEQLAEGIRVVEMNAISPDDAAIHIDAGDGAILFADSIVNKGSGPTFVSDSLLGDDPEQIKTKIRDRAAALLDSEDFEALLFAHGNPITENGAAALRRFSQG